MEKAFKAVLYYRDAKSSCINENSLVIIACAVGDDTLRNLARQLEGRVGDHRRMRYPSLLMYPRIPADMYDADDAGLACDLAARAVDRVETILGVSTFVFIVDNFVLMITENKIRERGCLLYTSPSPRDFG